MINDIGMFPVITKFQFTVTHRPNLKISFLQSGLVEYLKFRHSMPKLNQNQSDTTEAALNISHLWIDDLIDYIVGAFVAYSRLKLQVPLWLISERCLGIYAMKIRCISMHTLPSISIPSKLFDLFRDRKF